MSWFSIDHLAEEIERVFADVPYPGDDKIGPALRAAPFRGWHWTKLQPEHLKEYAAELTAVSTPEAFHFYLPAMMLGAVLHHEDIDPLNRLLIQNLRPADNHPDSTQDLLHKISLLHLKQRAAVNNFLGIYHDFSSIVPEWGWSVEEQEEIQAASDFWYPLLKRTEADNAYLPMEDVVAEIQQAFADTPYPGHENIGRYWENEDLRDVHWRHVGPEILIHHKIEFFSLSPEGFRFYLPAALLCTLLHNTEADILGPLLISNLRMPELNESDGWHGTRNDWREKLTDILELMTLQEKKAVYKFLLKCREQSYDWGMGEKEEVELEEAIEFWWTLTANGHGSSGA